MLLWVALVVIHFQRRHSYSAVQFYKFYVYRRAYEYYTNGCQIWDCVTLIYLAEYEDKRRDVVQPGRNFFLCYVKWVHIFDKLRKS
jgi:hypothetical protein